MPDKARVHLAQAPARHWVGDGFPVHGLFDYQNHYPNARSPFLLLDYAAPTQFEPSPGHRRGVGPHPHRGFETVTIVFDGEVEHRDSAGGGGIIGPGDVQWMTAGSGIIHEEFHAPAYSERGGPFHMVQLWVNLPARDKMVPARYQAIQAADIPTVTLNVVGKDQATSGQPIAAPTMRLIAGQCGGLTGPAQTYTPMTVGDLHLPAGTRTDLPQPEGWTTLLVVLAGQVRVNGDTAMGPAQCLTLSRAGTGLHIEADTDAHCLLLSGEPINEPIVGYGPFVMNDKAGIAQAIADFQSGRYGQLG